MKADFDGRWRALSEAVQREMKAWRLQHPRATLNEMEAALDERLDRQRACMLEDMALASDVADLRLMPPEERCLQTEGDQEITLQRSYGVCPTCGVGFFPSG